MENKTILGLGIAGLLFWGISRFFGSSQTNKSNKETEKLDSVATWQAQQFYNYFGIKKIGALYTATPVLTEKTEKRILWLAENVEDWAAVQRSFSALCGNSYTITQAASTALSTVRASDFNTLISAALKRSRIYAKEDLTTYKEGGDFTVDKIKYTNGAYLGRCVKSDSVYNYFVYWNDGYMYRVAKDKCKLI